ncbi:MAG TPA: tRNA (adenosine(37)-N6)-threonylcarbamoyltransferase complex dimerization subunit type 1 TsaB [Betaproteobacteria bacterium]|nr:tRNA (adenosine(37)-N6)-threonylcarbamoyltransferase complex dimerization subunit type 1 TsaB [Burkholderiales bacterium]HBZ17994.1 tRNA (adenosine(37)-N6)-threonylcarbamoyltransferase complex dimerization subunit type 1 TsaB [Betaproteobacteria bacterium]
MNSESVKMNHKNLMLNILAIETSTEMCSVALLVGGKLTLSEKHVGQKHSEEILPMIDQLILKSDIVLNQIDVIGFGAGPGSFTGVRLACGVAQGLAFGLSVPVVPVSSLEALAQATNFDRVLICQDARMNQVYAAAYERKGDIWSPLTDPYVCDPQDVTVPLGGGWVVCGSGLSSYAEAFESYFGLSGPTVNVDYVNPSAKEVLLITEREFKNGQYVSAENAAPMYVRNKVALTLDEQASR